MKEKMVYIIHYKVIDKSEQSVDLVNIDTIELVKDYVGTLKELYDIEYIDVYQSYKIDIG